jgi:hypothetical protein
MPNPSSETSPRRQVSSHGPEAEALLDEVQSAVATLGQLLSHGDELGESTTLAIRAATDEVSTKQGRRELRVVVVGEERSGKSTFLDALLGERLLGMTKTPPNMVTTIRSTPDFGYRARLTDGLIDDFSLRVPDRTAHLMTEVEDAETKLAEAKRHSVAASIELAGAADALEGVEAAMTEAFRALETARAEAEVCGTKLETTERRWGQLSTDATERAHALPALFRGQPPWWAVWFWAIRLVARLIYWPTWRQHRAILLACGNAEKEVDELRAESSRAAERCWQAEAKLSIAHVPVEHGRGELEALRLAAGAAEAACESLRQEVAQRRRKIYDERSERKRRFVADIRALCSLEDRGKDVVELEIDFPARLLPEDIVLIEAPGVTCDDIASSERAWRAIRERADACILVSELEHAVSGDTQRFLQPLREAVPHAILLLTKMDETIGEARRKGDGDPAEKVEHARRIGTRRFAREMGRDPTSALSMTVAAEETLRDAASSEQDRSRFETDVAKLFALLHYERALILGAASASIVRRCIGDLAEAQATAELAYRDRIAELEAARIPDPAQFYEEQMASADGVIAERAKEVVTTATSVLRENAELTRLECAAKITGCETTGDLRRLARELGAMMTRGLTSARDKARARLDEASDQSAQGLERNVLQALKERYYILHQITRPPEQRVVVDAPLVHLAPAGDLAAKLDIAIRSFDRYRLIFGVAGAVLGGAVGTLIWPGIGSLAGALVGSLATFAKTLGGLKRDFSAASGGSMADLERVLGEQFGAAEPAVAAAMRASLGKSLDHALARFAPFIEEPIEEGRAAIASERERLHELEALYVRLKEHDTRLASLIKTATDASVGLCR